jgi:type II secretory pathway pseudopilin PulG
MESNQEPVQSIQPVEQKQKSGWKMPLIVAAIAIIAAVLAGGVTWYLMNQSQNSLRADNDKSVAALQKQINDLKKAQTTVPAPTTATTDWHTYKNTDYGFQLNFGNKWSGYTVTKASTPFGTALAEYDFKLPTSDTNYTTTGNNPATVFSVLVYKTTAFQAIDRSHPVPILPTAIVTKGDKTFAYYPATQWATDWTLKESDVPAVISTFSFT